MNEWIFWVVFLFGIILKGWRSNHCFRLTNYFSLISLWAIRYYCVIKANCCPSNLSEQSLTLLRDSKKFRRHEPTSFTSSSSTLQNFTLTLSPFSPSPPPPLSLFLPCLTLSALPSFPLSSYHLSPPSLPNLSNFFHPPSFPTLFLLSLANLSHCSFSPSSFPLSPLFLPFITPPSPSRSSVPPRLSPFLSSLPLSTLSHSSLSLLPLCSVKSGNGLFHLRINKVHFLSFPPVFKDENTVNIFVSRRFTRTH